MKRAKALPELLSPKSCQDKILVLQPVDKQNEKDSKK